MISQFGFFLCFFLAHEALSIISLLISFGIAFYENVDPSNLDIEIMLYFLLGMYIVLIIMVLVIEFGWWEDYFCTSRVVGVLFISFTLTSLHAVIFFYPDDDWEPILLPCYQGFVAYSFYDLTGNHSVTETYIAESHHLVIKESPREKQQVQLEIERSLEERKEEIRRRVAIMEEYTKDMPPQIKEIYKRKIRRYAARYADKGFIGETAKMKTAELMKELFHIEDEDEYR